MIHINRVFTRPSADIPFPNKSIDASHFAINYDGTGKRLYIGLNLSQDLLSLHQESIWASIDFYNEALNDPICQEYWRQVEEYCTNNNIKMSEKTITEL